MGDAGGELAKLRRLLLRHDPVLRSLNALDRLARLCVALLEPRGHALDELKLHHAHGPVAELLKGLAQPCQLVLPAQRRAVVEVAGPEAQDPLSDRDHPQPDQERQHDVGYRRHCHCGPADSQARSDTVRVHNERPKGHAEHSERKPQGVRAPAA